MKSGLSLYQALIQPLRQLDESKLLERFLVGPQAVFERTEQDILTLLNQIKPAKARADVLQWLKAIVGFTIELRSITDRLTEQQLRRLVQLAVPLWKQRETERGIVNAVRLLTGRSAYITNWFGFRNILGETAITEDQLIDGGDNWIIGGSITTYDEFWTNIRIMDDGTLDELLLVDIIRLMRPLSERVEIFLDDFLDRFDSELDKWTFTAGSAGLPTIGWPIVGQIGAALKLLDGAYAKPVVPILPNNAAHVNYNIVAKFHLVSPTTLVVRFYDNGNDRYELELRGDSVNNVQLSRYTGGAPTTMVLMTSPIIHNADWHKLRIGVVTNGANREIKIFIDSTKIIPTVGDALIDSSGVPPSSGPYQFGTLGSTDQELYLDNVESWRNPGRYATIGISTLTERGGQLTMSSNFIQ